MSVLDFERTSRERGDSAAKAWLRALSATAPIAAHPRRTLPVVIDELAEHYGAAPALLCEHETLTYQELAARANRYARWALERGIAPGDTVCLFMPNRPEYLAIWLGVTRVGGIVALLDTSLTGTALAHCINIVAPKHVIVAIELISAVMSARPHLTGGARIFVHEGNHADFTRQSGAPLGSVELPRVTIQDRALLIYTSGATGQPKAANISHQRLLNWSYWFAGMMDTCPTDRMYDCLPMYHSAGGVVAIGALLVHGGSVVIREKFSARSFWDDIARFDCTLFQYTGELCRYLLHAPFQPTERAHRLRIACGNGLQADVWTAFKERFQLPQVLEFYAATEGNFSLYNTEGEPGSIGRIPPFLARRLPIALIRHDVDKDAPIRNADGFCIRCAADEIGEAIGRIASPSAAGPAAGDALPRIARRKTRVNALMRWRDREGAPFEGYTDASASEKKILRNVFAPGDAWYRTGDLMRRDARGFFYFVDHARSARQRLAQQFH
jgi:fatty-acyl-CoA synthase